MFGNQTQSGSILDVMALYSMNEERLVAALASRLNGRWPNDGEIERLIDDLVKSYGTLGKLSRKKLIPRVKAVARKLYSKHQAALWTPERRAEFYRRQEEARKWAAIFDMAGRRAASGLVTTSTSVSDGAKLAERFAKKKRTN